MKPVVRHYLLALCVLGLFLGIYFLSFFLSEINTPHPAAETPAERQKADVRHAGQRQKAALGVASDRMGHLERGRCVRVYQARGGTARGSLGESKTPDAHRPSARTGRETTAFGPIPSSAFSVADPPRQGILIGVWRKEVSPSDFL